MPRSWIYAILLLTATTTLCAESDRDLFESRIRPLFLEHCVQCHGGEKQKAGLRLDSRAGWAAGGDSGRKIIVPGKPSESLLMWAVEHRDEDLAMPPKKKLEPAQIAHLREWIQRGAFDPRDSNTNESADARLELDAAREFWSFRPVIRPDAPSARGQGAHPIDAFIAAAYSRESLAPVELADKRTLIRRVTFDLTGLPPTPEEIRAYLADDSANAFATLVDRLLESRAYGERWGRHWLDVARYADTAGDGSDYPVREAGKYRDWVIDAFRRDKPFDEFVREQIAGDIIAKQNYDAASPDRERELRKYADLVTATGFLAIGKRYGYRPSPAFQHLDFADVIDSIGRSLLGLSIGCARCHDHKYDPISTQDYYALYGILESTTWAFPGGEEHKRPAHFPPLVPPEELARREKESQAEVARIDAGLTALKAERAPLDLRRFAGGVDLDLESQTLGKPLVKPWVCSGPIEVREDAQSPYVHTHPKGKRGVRIGSGKPTDGIRYVFEKGLRASSSAEIHLNVEFRTVESSKEKGAFRFYLGRGVVQSLAVECSVTSTKFAIRDGTKWIGVRELTPGRWYTLRLSIDSKTKTYSGFVGTSAENEEHKLADLVHFENRKTGPGWDGVVDTFICDAFGHVPGPACARDIDNVGLADSPFGNIRSGPIERPRETAATKKRLAEIDAEIAGLEKQRMAAKSKALVEVAYGVSEGKPTDTHVQIRGERHRRGPVAPRRFLEVLGGDRIRDSKTTSGRLDLADWLTPSSNPLTARVFVNRVWGWHFGRGLVATPSDFGSRGEEPTHPELLDWLCSEFVANGQSVKALHRLILSSRTYQLASVDHAENLARDPSNLWYWRHSRRTLDAESTRDTMLALSGNLDRSVPKSHPFPPVNTWGFTIHHPFHAVYESDRRSVYLMQQRNRPHPFLSLFDGADPNMSVAARLPTTTPKQALFLMNSPFVHKQADGFGKRIAAHGDEIDTKLTFAFESAHGRDPSPAQRREAREFFEAYRSQSNDDAAWSALARVLLTSNAFLYVD